MKNIIKRDSRGVAILDTTKRRMIFSLTVIFGITASIISFATLLFIPYWIFTGKNIFEEILDI